MQEALGHILHIAKNLITQTRSHKTKDKQPKLYNWHAPEVECISKCKSRNAYDSGVKVGIASTLKDTLIVGARSFPGNAYDGHTLNEQVEQAGILMPATGVMPQTAIVNLGYRGVDKDNQNLNIKRRGKFKSIKEQERKLLKRQQAIDPIIAHLKAEHRMYRCYLKGSKGDSLHAVLCATGYKIRWLPRVIARKDVRLFFAR